MKEKSNRYALAALKGKRAIIAAEIAELDRTLRQSRDALVHIDATLRLFDPGIDLDAIPNKQLRSKIAIFKRGELSRLVMDVLRTADKKTIGTSEIVAGVATITGHDVSVERKITPSVRNLLDHFARRKLLAKIKDGHGVRWRLV